MARQPKPNQRKRFLQHRSAASPLMRGGDRPTPPAGRLRASFPSVFSGGPLDEDGHKWPIVIQEAGPWRKHGPSGHVLYTLPEALQAAVEAGLFEGAKSYRNHQTDQQAEEMPERDQGDVIGVVTDTRWDPAIGPFGAAVGVWNILDTDTHARVANAHRLGVLDNYGSFSITASGETEIREIDGQTFEAVTAFTADAIASVDHVTEPAAGGRFLTRLAASLRANQEDPVMKWTDLPAAVRRALLACASDDEAKELLAALEIELAEGFEAEMLTARAEAVKPDLEAAPEPDADPEPTPEPKPAEEPAEVAAAAEALAETRKLQASIQAEMLKTLALTKLKACDLDDATQADIKPALLKAADGETMDKLIGARRDYLAKLQAAPEFTGSLLRGGVEAGADPTDKFRAGLEGFFFREHGPNRRTPVELDGIKIPPFHSLAEACMYHPDFRDRRHMAPLELQAAFRGTDCWYQGEHDGGTVVRAGRTVRLTAAASRAQFAEVFADTANKVMQSLWSSSDRVDEIVAWASMVDERDDFNDARYIQLGEYANAPSVAEGGTYNTLTTPGDVEEKEGLTKYGFVESITLEALTDRDGQKLAALPKRMTQSMLRTFRELFINEITTTNPTLNSDSTALYAGGHSNQGTTALTQNGLNTIAIAMAQQTAAGSSKRYGSQLRPWGLIVPTDLEHLALRIRDGWPGTQKIADANASALFEEDKFKGIKVLVSDQATNAKDYWIMADPGKFDTFVVQWLRGVGSNIQFFAQDAESSTLMMGSDQTMWKVRGFAGVEPLNYRSFYYMNVA